MMSLEKMYVCTYVRMYMHIIHVCFIAAIRPSVLAIFSQALLYLTFLAMLAVGVNMFFVRHILCKYSAKQVKTEWGQAHINVEDYKKTGNIGIAKKAQEKRYGMSQKSRRH